MILVTTPNGKVGSALAAQLLERGEAVRLGAHTPAKAQADFAQAQVVHFDFGDPASVRAALAGVAALYLAAPATTDPEQVNRVVDLAVEAGVRRIVRLSAAGVEHSETGLRQIERHIEGSGVEWTMLRPSWFFQNYSTANAAAIRERGAIFEAAGDGKTAFVDTRDIAAVAVRALTESGHHGQGYTITGGRAYDRSEVASAIGAAAGRPVRYVALTDAAFRDSVAPLGWPPEYVELMSGLYAAVRAGHTAATTDVVQRVTGQAPISLEQFANDSRDAWRSRNA